MWNELASFYLRDRMINLFLDDRHAYRKGRGGCDDEVSMHSYLNQTKLVEVTQVKQAQS